MLYLVDVSIFNKTIYLKMPKNVFKKFKALKNNFN